eukprot:2520705-Amphidinium_carterae.1
MQIRAAFHKFARTNWRAIGRVLQKHRIAGPLLFGTSYTFEQHTGIALRQHLSPLARTHIQTSRCLRELPNDTQQLIDADIFRDDFGCHFVQTPPS